LLHRGAIFFVFFFQAEDGIRDRTVTGVQTCALPISPSAAVSCSDPLTRSRAPKAWLVPSAGIASTATSRSPSSRVGARAPQVPKIGRASCRERVGVSVGGGDCEEEGGIVCVICVCVH